MECKGDNCDNWGNVVTSHANKIVQYKKERKENRKETKQLREQIKALQEEMERLKRIFAPIEAKARLTFELATMEILIDDNPKKGADRLAQIIVAWSEETQRAEKAEAQLKEKEEHIEFLEAFTCHDCQDTGWLENRVDGRYPCTCFTECEGSPYDVAVKALEKITKGTTNCTASDFEDNCHYIAGMVLKLLKKGG